MKFLPLLWASWTRQPGRAALTFLSVTIAFALLGLMLGINAGFDRIIETARLDRLMISARFGGELPLTYISQLRSWPNIRRIGYFGMVGGYFQNRRKTVSVIMLDEGMENVWPELSLTSADYAALRSNLLGVFLSGKIAKKLDKATGDNLPIVTAFTSRKDGSNLWLFHVLGVRPDISSMPNGYIVGSYSYFDQARPVKRQGKVEGIQVLVGRPEQAAAVALEIDNAFANSSTPTKSIPEKEGIQSVEESSIDIRFVTLAIGAAGLFMLLFLVSNNIAQSVRDRSCEFAVLGALGYSAWKLTSFVFCEAAIPCLAGCLLGLILSDVMGNFIPMLAPARLSLPTLYISASVLFTAIVASLVIAGVSSALPMIEVSKMNLAQGLKQRANV